MIGELIKKISILQALVLGIRLVSLIPAFVLFVKTTRFLQYPILYPMETAGTIVVISLCWGMAFVLDELDSWRKCQEIRNNMK